MLPGRKPLVTPRDAAQHTIKLPEAEIEMPDWEAAIEWLMLVGDRSGDPMTPRIAMVQAPQRHEPEAPSEPRRKRAKTARII
jgi:hypothetical protein